VHYFSCGHFLFLLLLLGNHSIREEEVSFNENN
jgi:hypothetical protein